MRKVILYIAASLDGFIAREDGSVDWLKPYEGEDYGYKEFYGSIDTVIMGNKTYKQALSFGEKFKGKKVFVFSRIDKGRKRNVTFAGNISFINKLEGNIWLVGGASIVNLFLAHDLIDEVIISIIPLMLGKGIPLFKKNTKEVQLNLIESKQYKTGIVQLHYKVNKNRT